MLITAGTINKKMTLALIASALAPVIAIIIYVYLKDKYEKEPLSLLLKSFALGVISIIPAILLETLADKIGMGISRDIIQTAIYAFIGVGFSEEFSKYLFLRFYVFPKKEFDEPFDGIVYSVMISMGFAAAENIMYVIEGGLSVAWARMFTAVPAHATFGILMGYYVGKAKFNNQGFLYMIRGLGLAVLLHGLYDFFLFTSQYYGLTFLSIVTLYFAIRLSFRAINASQDESPHKRWKFK